MSVFFNRGHYIYSMRFLASIILLCLALSVIAQENPFELKHVEVERVDLKNENQIVENPFRLKRENIAIEQPTLDEEVNPFSIDKTREGLEVKKTLPIPIPVAKEVLKTEVGSPRAKIFISIVGVVLFSLLFIFFKKNYTEAFSALKNQKVSYQLFRNKGGSIVIEDVLIYGFSLLVFATITLRILEVFKKLDFTLTNWSLLFLGFVSFYLVKHFILNLLDYLFNVKQKMQYYGFSLQVFNKLIGFILFPLLIILLLVDDDWVKYIAYLSVVVVVVFILLRLFRLLLSNLSFILSHKFHFIIYLCVLEFSPIIILAKIMLR